MQGGARRSWLLASVGLGFRHEEARCFCCDLELLTPKYLVPKFLRRPRTAIEKLCVGLRPHFEESSEDPHLKLLRLGSRSLPSLPPPVHHYAHSHALFHLTQCKHKAVLSATTVLSHARVLRSKLLPCHHEVHSHSNHDSSSSCCTVSTLPPGPSSRMLTYPFLSSLSLSPLRAVAAAKGAPATSKYAGVNVRVIIRPSSMPLTSTDLLQGQAGLDVVWPAPLGTRQVYDKGEKKLKSLELEDAQGVREKADDHSRELGEEDGKKKDEGNWSGDVQNTAEPDGMTFEYQAVERRMIPTGAPGISSSLSKAIESSVPPPAVEGASSSLAGRLPGKHVSQSHATDRLDSGTGSNDGLTRIIAPTYGGQEEERIRVIVPFRKRGRREGAPYRNDGLKINVSVVHSDDLRSMGGVIELKSACHKRRSI